MPFYIGSKTPTRVQSGTSDVSVVYAADEHDYTLLWKKTIADMSEFTVLNTPGQVTVTVPDWARGFDIICIGGGGGGNGGFAVTALDGKGGSAGKVTTKTVDVTGQAGKSIALVVGAGGAAETKGDGSGASFEWDTGISSLVYAAGGDRGSGGTSWSSKGGDVGTYTAWGITGTGGTGGAMNVAGSWPGGGGGGGDGWVTGYAPGRPGANGMVAYRFTSYPS